MQYLIRYYNKILECKAFELHYFLKANGYNTKVIDHTNLKISDFNISNESIPLSIDKFLSVKFNIEYFKVSRIFSESGNIVGLFLGNYNKNKKYHIIDTDIVTGRNLITAKSLTEASNSSYLLKIENNQELIDIEDLVFENSMLEGGKACSYLLNDNFFNKRTSLPKALFKNVKKLISK